MVDVIEDRLGARVVDLMIDEENYSQGPVWDPERKRGYLGCVFVMTTSRH
jgi:hypothetical protein